MLKQNFKKILFLSLQSKIIISSLCALGIAYFFSTTVLGKIIDLKILDFQFHFAQGTHKADSSIVIITIDQNSLQYFQKHAKVRYPFPRDFYALLTEYLSNAGAKAIVYDMLFTEPDDDRMYSLGSENDKKFAEAIKKSGNVYLAAQLSTSDSGDQQGDVLIKTPTTDFSLLFFIPPAYFFNKVFSPLMLFQNSAAGIGSVNYGLDEDGVCRKMPLIYGYDGGHVFTLSYEVYRNLYGKEKIDSMMNARFQFSPLMLYWYGKGGPNGVFPYYSFHSVIVDALQERKTGEAQLRENFNNKIVFIGSNAVSLFDLKNTPFTSEEPYPGVEIHATLLSNLLQKHFIQEISLWLLFIICFCIALSVSFFTYRKNIFFSTSFAVTFIGIFLFSNFLLFSYFLFWIPSFLIITTIIFSYGISLAWNFASEGRIKRKIEKTFGHYVNPHVVKTLITNPDSIELGGKEENASVMFCDIVNFTTLAEQQSPKEVVDFLNTYFSYATEIVFRKNGTVDKFIGDAVMVLFGVPLPLENHPHCVCETALEFHQSIKLLRAKFKEKNFPEFSTRIGINTGKMVVGNIGGKERLEYTAVGDTVNIASRLEGVNKLYGTSIIISQYTAQKVQKDFILRELDTITVQGKKKSLTIFELIGKKEEETSMLSQFLQEYHFALQLYKAREWGKARNQFYAAQELQYADAVCTIYIQRCEKFLIHPPSEYWDGVHSIENK